MLLDAEEGFNEVITSGYDTDLDRANAVKDAIAEIEQAKNIYSNMDFGTDDEVKRRFAETISDMEEYVAGEKLRMDIEFDLEDQSTSELFGKIKNELEAFEDESGSISASSILAAKTSFEEKDRQGLKDFTAEESLDSLISQLITFGYVQGDTSDVAYDSTQRFAELSTAASKVQSNMSTLTSALEEQAGAGELTVGTYNELIAASPEFANCLEFEAGSYQINADKARELVKAQTEVRLAEIELQKAQDIERWKMNAEEIDRLSNSYDANSESVQAQIAKLQQENDTIEDTVTYYNLLRQQLESTISAYSAWKHAQSTADQGAMYDDLISAKKDIEEGIKTGKVGTDQYEAAVELLIPDEPDQNQIEAYMSKLNRYLTEGSDAGVKNFLADAVNAGLMEVNNGEYKLNPDVSLQDFIDKLQITPEMAKAIFGELEEYNFEFDWQEQEFDELIDKAALERELEALDERLNSLFEERELKLSTEDEDGLPDVEEDIWQTIHQKIEVEVESSDQTDVEKAMESYTLAYAEYMHALSNGDDTIELEQSLAEKRALIESFNENTKLEYNVDTDLLDYGIASVTDALANLEAAAKNLEDVKVKFGVDSEEYEIAYQRFETFKSVFSEELLTKLGIEMTADQLVESILNGTFDPSTITVDIKPESTVEGEIAEEKSAAESNGITVKVDADTSLFDEKIASVKETEITVSADIDFTDAAA